jgi:FkbM family methyltransferase
MKTHHAERREPYDVQLMRAALRHWPLPRGRWFFLKMCKRFLKNRDFLMEVEPGLFMPAELDDWMHFWCFMGEYPGSDPSVLLSRRLIHSGQTVFDVGANIGLWVMGAAVAAGPTGNVHAFEPVPEIHARIEHNLKLNQLDWVHLWKLGLSDAPGSAPLFRDSTYNSGRGSLAKREGVDNPVEIKLTTLEAHCAAHKIDRIDFLKVDVEGAELKVFQGADRFLSSKEAPIILFECSEILVKPFGTTSTEIKRFLADRGYRIYRFEGKRLEEIPVEKSQGDKIEDVWAIQPRHFERERALAAIR